MQRRWIYLVLASALLTAGCLSGGSGDEVTETSADTEDEAREEETSASPSGTDAGDGEDNQTREPIQHTFEGTATAGVPVYDPAGSTGAKADFARTSYENGLNGTWLLGYEIEVPSGYESLVVDTSSAGGAAGATDYDLFLYAPDGSLVDQSFSGGSNERASVQSAEKGTYLAIGYLFSGAQSPLEMVATIE